MFRGSGSGFTERGLTLKNTDFMMADPTSSDFHKAVALKRSAEIMQEIPEYFMNPAGPRAFYYSVLGLAKWIKPIADEEFLAVLNSIKVPQSSDEKLRMAQFAETAMLLWDAILMFFRRKKWIKETITTTIRIPTPDEIEFHDNIALAEQMLEIWEKETEEVELKEMADEEQTANGEVSEDSKSN